MTGSGSIIRRERLRRALDGALTHRLTALVADAGFGKTTLLRDWSTEINAATLSVDEDVTLLRFTRDLVDALRLRVPDLPRELSGALTAALGPGAVAGPARPEAIAEQLGHELQQRLVRDLALVIDNAHHLAGGASARLLTGLIRHAPPLLHVVLSARTLPDVPVERLREQGQVLEFHGADLSFTTEEVATLVELVLGDGDDDLVAAVRAATGGWPVAVRLTVEALRTVDGTSRTDRVAELSAPRGQLHALSRRIFEREPAATKRLLAIAGLLDHVSVELCVALGIDSAGELVAGLVQRGLFLETVPGETDRYRLHALARDFVTEHAPISEDEATDLRVRAADRFVAERRPAAALRPLVEAGRHDAVVHLLADHGEHLATSGHADAVIAAVEELPPGVRDVGVERLAGIAHHALGEWDEALAHYERAAAGREELDADLAWRMGLIHHLRGDRETALSIYGRGRVDDAPSPGVALLLAWTAAAHWLRSDPESCGAFAVRALEVATAVDDPQALAAAHTVLAMLAALEGDRRANDAHYLKALEYAERAGDVLQLIRIHTNRASHHAEEGAYLEALAVLDVAVRLADLSGFAAFGALALSNRAETRLHLGRIEEAHSDLDAAITAFSVLGSRLVSYPLRTLAEVRHLEGDDHAARRAYERAIARATEAGDVQGEIPAVAGLARLVAATEPERAAELAERAIAGGEGMGYVAALLARADVALARGARDEGRSTARAARRAAEARRDRAGMAEALELEARATADDHVSIGLAERAIELWTEIGAPIGRARAELVRAERLDDVAARTALTSVRKRMNALGCRSVAARAITALSRLAPTDGAAVRIETLGGFAVLRDGSPVPHGAWQSRKARDLLKILVARRGRPVAREQLMETLWPGQEPDALANRFNVAVSTLRSVLDPERGPDAPALVSTDDEVVRLDLDLVSVDVEGFVDDAAAGLRLLQTGRTPDALERLRRAETAYTGDFLEEDIYADWAAPLREEARATYVQVAGRLAEHALEEGDPDAAIRYLLRILSRDPYDEGAHLRLVSTLAAIGRHGGARRHYRTYCERMEELGVEAAPFPKASVRATGPGVP